MAPDNVDGSTETKSDDTGAVWEHDFQADVVAAPADDELRNLDLMLDVPLEVAVELGRAQMALAELLALGPGSVVELDRLPGEPIDMHVNGRLVARGEIVVVNETLGFRITEIV
jgi:flagellar motor switch protein FliN